MVKEASAFYKKRHTTQNPTASHFGLSLWGTVHCKPTSLVKAAEIVDHWLIWLSNELVDNTILPN